MVFYEGTELAKALAGRKIKRSLLVSIEAEIYRKGAKISLRKVKVAYHLLTIPNSESAGSWRIRGGLQML